MGGSCRNVQGRETVYVGGWCENNCFAAYGGCEAGTKFGTTKTHDTCELKPSKPNEVDMDKANSLIDGFTKQGKSVFVYTPDMFGDYYYKECFLQLPNRNGNTYLAVNAGARSFLDKGDWAKVYERGIRELWVGIESGASRLRNLYGKPSFLNEEAVEMVKEGHKSGVNICWFLVDGDEDNKETRLATYNLIKQAQPFRVIISELRKYT